MKIKDLFKKKPPKKNYLCRFKENSVINGEKYVFEKSIELKAYTFKEARELIRKKYKYTVSDIKVFLYEKGGNR